MRFLSECRHGNAASRKNQFCLLPTASESEGNEVQITNVFAVSAPPLTTQMQRRDGRQRRVGGLLEELQRLVRGLCLLFITPS